MEKGIFYKTLVFNRKNFKDFQEPKIAEFVDMNNNTSRVVTTWNKIVPGLRYNCKLVFDSIVEDIVFYKLLGFGIVEDNIQIKTNYLKPNCGNSVEVYLDNKVVPNLTFTYDCDIDNKVKELKDYFKFKTFQLSNKEDIENFIGLYEKTCKDFIRGYKKNIINSFDKKKGFKQKFILN